MFSLPVREGVRGWVKPGAAKNGSARRTQHTVTTLPYSPSFVRGSAGG